MVNALVPGKRVTQVIQSHHHFDHSVGLRAAVAQGLTIISRRGNEGIFREMVARPAKLFPDALGRSPKPLKFIPVDDHLKLKDSTNEIDIYHIVGNYHMADGVIVHVPASNLLVEADLTTQEWDFNWWGDSLMNNIEYRKIKVDTNLAVHAQKPYPARGSRRGHRATGAQRAGVLPPCRRGPVLPAGLPDSVQPAAAAGLELSGIDNRYASLMKSVRVLSAVVVIASLAVTAVAQQRSAGRSTPNGPLALVGGTLIDGTGSAPIRDSVVLIRGERIEKIGTTDSLPVPDGYLRVSTEGLTVLPGLWDLHVHLMYARPSGFAPLVRHLHAAVRAGHHARVGRAAADGRRDNRARSRGAAAAHPGRQAAHRERRDPRARRCTSLVRRSRKAGTRMPSRRGMSRGRPMRGRRPAN